VCILSFYFYRLIVGKLSTGGYTTYLPKHNFCLYLGLIIVSLKRKYEQMYVGEVVGAFALYTILMAMFTNPVIEAVKTFVS